MPVFTYRGTNRAGAKVAGERTAETKDAAQGGAAPRERSTSASSPKRGRSSTFPRSEPAWTKRSWPSSRASFP